MNVYQYLVEMQSVRTGEDLYEFNVGLDAAGREGFRVVQLATTYIPPPNRDEGPRVLHTAILERVVPSD